MGKTPEQWHALEKKHRMYVYSAGNQSTEGIEVGGGPAMVPCDPVTTRARISGLHNTPQHPRAATSPVDR